MTDIILELVWNVVGVVVEVFAEAFATSDTVANRIFLGFVIATTVGVIWWELH